MELIIEYPGIESTVETLQIRHTGMDSIIETLQIQYEGFETANAEAGNFLLFVN